MLRTLVFIAIISVTASASAQNPSQQAAPAQGAPASDKPPQVKYNYLNVCTPTGAEQQQLKSALGRLPAAPKYSADFEISRGRTSLQDAEPARYLRLRRELTNSPEFNNVQYSLTSDANDTHETLVVKVKDPKDLLLVSLEDKVSSTATSPSSLLDVDTPASHIKLERFGKSSVVLARCEASDQSAYEPLFRRASEIFAAYRKSLGLRSTFRNDLNWLVTSGENPKPKSKPAKVQPAPKASTGKSSDYVKPDAAKLGQPKSN